MKSALYWAAGIPSLREMAERESALAAGGYTGCSTRPPAFRCLLSR
jgi:hypothetical protein